MKVTLLVSNVDLLCVLFFSCCSALQKDRKNIPIKIVGNCINLHDISKFSTYNILSISNPQILDHAAAIDVTKVSLSCSFNSQGTR